MISRIWHGYTALENAEAYENLLKAEIFPNIIDRSIPGFHKIELLKRETGDEVEFITIMLFEGLDDIRQFAGENYESSVVLPEAQALLKRYDMKSQHYEVLNLSYGNSV